MTGSAATHCAPHATAERPATLVWIDSSEAIVVRWDGHDAVVTRIESDVPAHRRATGHVSHNPNLGHGGGRPQSAGEPNRLEHLARFVDAAAEHIPSEDDLLLIGPGRVHEHLGRHVREADARRRAVRRVDCERAGRMTRRQLVARLRRAVGNEPRRHTVGAYRWSSPGSPATSGRPEPVPHRVTEKHEPHRRG